MGKKRNTKKRTTPEIPASERLATWQGGSCPYCGNTQVLKHAKDNAEGTVHGLHFTCAKCKAQNHFSNKRLIGAD